jgi:hypothetical protein
LRKEAEEIHLNTNDDKHLLVQGIQLEIYGLSGEAVGVVFVNAADGEDFA